MTLLTWLHPLFHRRGDMRACWICRMVWAKLEATPGFNEEMVKAEADLAAGLGTPLREIRRDDES